VVGEGVSAILDALLPILTAFGISLPVAAAMLIRTSTFVMLLPGIGEGMTPMQVRIFVAFAFTAMLLPIVDAPVEAITVPLLVSEALIGLAFGFTVRVFFFALSLTGALIAQALSLSQVFGFASQGDSSGLLSTTLTLTATVLFFSTDFDILVIEQFTDGLAELPLGQAALLDTGGLSQRMTDLAAVSFRLGLTLAIPFSVLNFAYYLTLGFINRAMPQLMVTFVGLPAIVLGGLILFMVCSTALLTVWIDRAMNGFVL